MNYLKKKEPNPPLVEDHGRKIKVAELLGQRFLERKSKIVDEDSHSTDLSVEVFPQFYWLITFFGEKCLEILLLLYNLHILASDPKKFLFFRAILSNFRDKKQLLSDFLRNYTLRKCFGKSRATCGKS